MELTLDRVKIIEDVRMIEADIVYNQGFRRREKDISPATAAPEINV